MVHGDLASWGHRRFALLIGAGASFGAWSGYDPIRPPLGGWLFDELVAASPDTWSALKQEQEAQFHADDPGLGFERGMGLLWQGGLHGEVDAQRLLSDMAVYFARFRLPAEASDCYSQLLREFARLGLIGERMAVATLNYECLLEEAAHKLGIRTDLSPVGPRAGVLTVWKPHGRVQPRHE